MNTTGFPSPAQGYKEKPLDFNHILITHPAATFTMRYTASDLCHYNILYGDLLIVDCAQVPKKGMLVIIKKDGVFICRELTHIQISNNKKKYTYVNKTGEAVLCEEIFGCVCSMVRLYDFSH
ncbi:MAG TPA: S24 family peptidase [Treponemataceae bacterium]|nr:S24 family peptidase [Treponemataceae bacterium]